MKYETPKLTALMPAINAIQSTSGATKQISGPLDRSSGDNNDLTAAYADWE